jgi:transglutaminase-like putative cysteine protease
MRIAFYLFNLIPAMIFCQSQSFNYPGFASFPVELLDDANSVVHYNHITVEITDDYKMTETYEWAVTVMNSSGNAHVRPRIFYRTSQKITSMSASVFDSRGKEIKKFKNKDILDVNAVSSISIFEDHRVKYFDYSPVTYPYTFRFKAVRKGSNTAFIPGWVPASNEYQSVVESHYQLSYPAGWTLTVSKHNFDAFDITCEEKAGYLKLTAKHLKSFRAEYNGPSYESYLPAASLSLNHFKLEGIEGYAETWADFGNWYRENMLVDQDYIPEITRNEIFRLIEGVNDSVEIARIIYAYVQSKTRYVNVAIGIGGWKPMSVDVVDAKGYGDCKALSNYTAALLRLAGLRAWYTIVYAGSRPRHIDTTQVTIQGNHIIVYVPLGDTAIWLETTGQTIPFGYLGTHSDNRQVLCLTDNGARILKTPAYPDSLNRQTTFADIDLNADGSFSATVHVQSEGTQYGMKSSLLDFKTEEKDEFYRNYWNYLQALTLKEIDINADKRNIIFDENIALEALAYGSLTGNRMLVAAGVFNRVQSVPPRHDDRKYPLEIHRGYLDEDTYLMKVPDGYRMEIIPDPVTIENQFGYYHLSLSEKDEQTIEVRRNIHIRSGTYSPDHYQEYYQFRKDISRYDESYFVLIKN